MGLPDGEKDLQNTWTRFKTMHDVTDGQTPHDGGGRAVHNVAEKSAESLSHLVWRSFWRMWVGVVLMIEDVIQCVSAKTPSRTSSPAHAAWLAVWTNNRPRLRAT